MPLAGRVGDNAKHDGGEEPAKQGSPDVFIDGHAVMRVGDEGKGWKAKKGSKGVLINGLPAHRVGDETSHDTGNGQLVDGSQHVFIGDLGGGEAKPVPHDKSLAIQVTDAKQRPIDDVTVKVSCPHQDDQVHKVSGGTTVSGLCSAATVTVQKPLQKGTWDKHASSPEILSPTHSADDASQSTLLVHAPAPPSTPPAQQEAHIVKPTTARAEVRLTTVHNWVETVFAAFGQTMPTGATELAILGVREASLGGAAKQSMVALEDAAGAGKTDQVNFTRSTRDANFADDPGWNDLLFVTYTDSTPAKTQHVDVYECTIDAGICENANGVPITLEGKLYGGIPGPHGSYPGNDICLHLFTGSPGQMAVAREYTKKYRTFEYVASAENALRNWLFCCVEPDPGIHMHFGSETGRVYNWSAGCTVLHHHYFLPGHVLDPNPTRYGHFRKTYLAASNKKKIPYLVVSSQYIRSYAEWAKLIDQDSTQATRNESVILKDKLREVPGAKGRYLPSFMQTAFAKAVLDLAAQKTTSETHAANLRASMELSTFTLSI
jgi:uncharacterized Zn-binding protein involved in type VI secretion